MTVPTPAVNVPDEIVMKVEALEQAADFAGATQRLNDIDDVKAARSDLLATIARHITPAPPADEELREAIKTCQEVATNTHRESLRSYGQGDGQTGYRLEVEAAAISTVLRAVQAQSTDLEKPNG
jgi:hypothetical protein